MAATGGRPLTDESRSIPTVSATASAPEGDGRHRYESVKIALARREPTALISEPITLKTQVLMRSRRRPSATRSRRSGSRRRADAGGVVRQASAGAQSARVSTTGRVEVTVVEATHDGRFANPTGARLPPGETAPSSSAETAVRLLPRVPRCSGSTDVSRAYSCRPRPRGG